MSATNSALLKTYFETGDVPTQTQFADFIDSYQNISDNGLFNGVTGSVAGVSPSSQGTAVGISKRYTRVITSGGGTSGCILMSSVQGGEVVIHNDSGAQLDIYPKVGEYILPNLINVPMSIQDGEAVILIGLSGGRWLPLKSVGGNSPVMKYRALISQAGFAAPTATVLENSMTTSPTFSYVGAGNYTITAAGLFTSGKVFARVQGSLTGAYFGTINSLVSPNTLQLQSINNIGVGVDARFSNTPLEILIYP